MCQLRFNQNEQVVRRSKRRSSRRSAQRIACKDAVEQVVALDVVDDNPVCRRAGCTVIVAKACLRRGFVSVHNDRLYDDAATFESRHLGTKGGCVSAEHRRVHFDGEVAVHEVVAYSEIYGVHPQLFVFDRHYSMLPAAGPYGFNGLDVGCSSDHEDGSSSDEDEF